MLEKATFATSSAKRIVIINLKGLLRSFFITLLVLEFSLKRLCFWCLPSENNDPSAKQKNAEPKSSRNIRNKLYANGISSI